MQKEESRKELIPGFPSSGGEFLFYQTEDGRIRLQVRVQDETVWLSQKLIAELFQKDVRTINEHIQNIFEEHELSPDSVIRKFRITATNGNSYDTVQNKIHWAAHGQTAAEVIHARVNAAKPQAGMTNWVGSKPNKAEAVIAKNYLSPEELNALNRIVVAYLELAEVQALNRKPMYMRDWIAKLDALHTTYARQLELLTEYRAALIQECETGHLPAQELRQAGRAVPV